MGKAPANRGVSAGARSHPGAAPSRGPTAIQSGAVLAAARRAPAKRASDKQQIRQVMFLGIGAVALVTVVMGVVLGIKGLKGPERPLLGKDAEVRKEMTRITYEEARSWMSQGHDRVLMGLTEGQSQRLIDDIYALGPKELLAGGGRVCMNLIIVLPENVESRSALFNWYNKRLGPDVPEAWKERDVGQQYLMVPVDRY